MSQSTKHYACFGGSFNPIHNGHVTALREIQKKYSFEKIWIIPCQNPPHKPAFEISTHDRLEMIRLATKDIKNVEILDFEIKSKSPSYSILTIEHINRNLLKAQTPNPRLHFILGTDAFIDLPKWYRYPELIQACSFLVIRRKGWGNSEKPSKKLKDNQGKLPQHIEFIDLDLPEVASSDIREKLKSGASIEALTPEPVVDYLIRNRLYAKNRIP